MKVKAAVTKTETQTGASAGMKIRTSLKAGRIMRNENRTLVARKKGRPGVTSDETQTGPRAGMKIRTSVKAGRIMSNVNRTLVARKKVRSR